MNCCVSPLGTDAAVGATVMVSSIGLPRAVAGVSVRHHRNECRQGSKNHEQQANARSSPTDQVRPQFPLPPVLVASFPYQDKNETTFSRQSHVRHLVIQPTGADGAGVDDRGVCGGGRQVIAAVQVRAMVKFPRPVPLSSSMRITQAPVELRV